MATSLHPNLPFAEIHTPIAFQYADASARTGASGFTVNDLYKFAHQQDDDTVWMLIATTPTWAKVGIGSEISDAEHGDRGGGSLHALATASVAGFMSSADKANLDSLGSGNVLVQVRNESGATLVKGKAVSIVGWSVGQQRPLVNLADKDDSAKRPSIGIVTVDIANNTNGEAIVQGTLKNVDTSAWSLTDQLVLGNSGALSRPPPDESPFTGEIQNIGSVSRVDATEGRIIVTIDGLHTTTAAQIFALAGTNGTPGPSNKYVTDSDSRNTNARTPTAHKDSHKSGGGDAFTSSDLLEAVVKRLRESGGPTDLTLGAVADGEVLKRSGSSIIGAASGKLKQTVFSEISSDTTTTSATFVDLLTANITTTGGGLLIHATVSSTSSGNSEDHHYQVLLDGTPKRGFLHWAKSEVAGSGAVVIYLTGVSAAAHTVKLQWRVSGQTGQIRPVTTIDEHASLLVQEVTA